MLQYHCSWTNAWNWSVEYTFHESKTNIKNTVFQLSSIHTIPFNIVGTVTQNEEIDKLPSFPGRIYNRSLLSSNLRQTIRLQDTGRALQTAYMYSKLSMSSLIQDVILISLEAIGVPQNIEWLIWMMFAKWSSEAILRYVLATVFSLAQCNEHKKIIPCRFWWTHVRCKEDIKEYIQSPAVMSLQLMMYWIELPWLSKQLLQQYVWNLQHGQKVTIVEIICPQEMPFTHWRDCCADDFLPESITPSVYPQMITILYQWLNRRYSIEAMYRMWNIIDEQINNARLRGSIDDETMVFYRRVYYLQQMSLAKLWIR